MYQSTSPSTPSRRGRQALEEDDEDTNKSRRVRPRVTSMNGITVLESSEPMAPTKLDEDDLIEHDEDDAEDEEEDADELDQLDAADTGDAHGQKGKKNRCEFDGFNDLPTAFSVDFFTAPAVTRLPRAAGKVAKAAMIDQAGRGELEEKFERRVKNGSSSEVEVVAASNENFEKWLETLSWQASLLVQGIGSKRELLESFADKVQTHWTTVRIDGYDPQFHLGECLRAVLAKFYPPNTPRATGTVSVLMQALQEVCAERAGSKPILCFVVHNLECLSRSHQAALARLVGSCCGVRLAASVDNMWAGIQWSPITSVRFNFVCKIVHTWKEFNEETEARYGEDLPFWTGLNVSRRQTSTSSLALVLRSLTPSHQELVQELARSQVKDGSGINMSAMLDMAGKKLIARTQTQLQALLRELQDHRVVVKKNSVEGNPLFSLPYERETLQRLADGVSVTG